ncbi:MAG: lytic transglycosylase domain-containing protein [Alsobacter sp.]
MFLFTSLPEQPEPRAASAPAKAPAQVVDAIRDGSARTGADFDYLLKTAQRESALDPAAKAKSSSATGLFQFIEQTWLGVMKGAGPEHGLGNYAQAISSANGRYEVSDPSLKAEILQLRNDPKTAAVMAGEFTRRNAQQLAGALGRQPTDGELYAAHFMGSSGAADLIKQVQAAPQANAAALFPDQAAANRSIFYDKASGRPRTVSEVYATLVQEAGTAGASGVPKLSSDPSTWLIGQASAQPVTVTAYAHADGPALHGLFRTEGVRGPLNQTVQRLWSGLPARAVEEDARRYFPRSTDAASGTTGGSSASPPSPGVVPLPRPRPVEFGGMASAVDPNVEPAERPARPDVTRRAVASRGRGPLDLTSFMKKDIAIP